MPAERSDPVTRRDLTLACAVIGLFGGALFGAMFSAPGYRTPWHGWESILGVAVPTAVTGTALGWFLERRAKLAFEAALCTFVAGALNGVLVLSVIACTDPPPHLDTQFVLVYVAALVAGVVAALPFAPMISAIAHVSAQVRARRGSIGEGSQRRRIARTVAVALTIGAFFVPTKHALLLRLVPALALLVTSGLLLWEWRSLRSLRMEGFAPVAVATEGSSRVDLGVGDQVWARTFADLGYRSLPRAEVRVGDPGLVESITRDSLRGHAVAAGVTLIVLVARSVF